MQLPIGGHPLHTRSVTLVVAMGEDARWHARGDILDLRKVGFVPMMDDIQPAGIIHQMSIDLVLDPDTRRIAEIAFAQPVVAVEPSAETSGESCRDPAPRLLALRGEALDDAFQRKLSAGFGGALGCSHLLTLFQLMAPSCVRALALEARLPAADRRARAAGERLYRRAVFVDGFEAPDGGIELAVQQSDFHTRPAAVTKSPFERLAGEWDVRLFTSVGADRTLSPPLLAVRERTHATLAEAEWEDGSDRLASLAGVPIIPGLARRLIDSLPDDADGRVREAGLQLAPGYIQVMAAVVDRWLTQRDASAGARGDTPADAGSVGGMPDSCYMWRRDGALATRGVRRGTSGVSSD